MFVLTLDELLLDRFISQERTMDTKSALKTNLQTAAMVCGNYLNDLTDEEAFTRPHPQCNHVNWQVGHLIDSEYKMASACSDKLPALPAGFSEKYTKETASSDNASDFVPISELRKIAATQHEAILSVVDNMPEEDFDKPGPESMKDYAATLGALVSMLGSHWMMHAGQFVVVRRHLGRDIII